MTIPDSKKRNASIDIGTELAKLRNQGATDQELAEVVQVALKRSEKYTDLIDSIKEVGGGKTVEDSIQNLSQMEPAD
jgi:hypothetical protein